MTIESQGPSFREIKSAADSSVVVHAKTEDLGARINMLMAAKQLITNALDPSKAGSITPTDLQTIRAISQTDDLQESLASVNAQISNWLSEVDKTGDDLQSIVQVHEASATRKGAKIDQVKGTLSTNIPVISQKIEKLRAIQQALKQPETAAEPMEEEGPEIVQPEQTAVEVPEQVPSTQVPDQPPSSWLPNVSWIPSPTGWMPHVVGGAAVASDTIGVCSVVSQQTGVVNTFKATAGALTQTTTLSHAYLGAMVLQRAKGWDLTQKATAAAIGATALALGTPPVAIGLALAAGELSRRSIRTAAARVGGAAGSRVYEYGRNYLKQKFTKTAGVQKSHKVRHKKAMDRKMAAALKQQFNP